MIALNLMPPLIWKLNNTLLSQTYMRWCSKNNEHIQSQKCLTMRMSEKGFKKLLTNGERVWIGLILKNEWQA